jgi:hypothetical protein
VSSGTVAAPRAGVCPLFHWPMNHHLSVVSTCCPMLVFDLMDYYFCFCAGIGRDLSKYRHNENQFMVAPRPAEKCTRRGATTWRKKQSSMKIRRLIDYPNNLGKNTCPGNYIAVFSDNNLRTPVANRRRPQSCAIRSTESARKRRRGSPANLPATKF